MSKKTKIYTIHVHCAGCQTRLYRYRKEGGGNLVKCFVDGITRDYTNGDLRCPNCGQEFARSSKIKNRPVHKIIRGKVFVKGHHG